MSPHPPPAAVSAWVRLVRAEQSLMDKIEGELKEAGLPPLNWYDVLLELDKAPDGRLAQQDVQSRTLLAQYNLCRLADRMEAEGLLQRRRCMLDGRNRHLVRTDKGREMRASMWPVYAAAISRHVAERLSEAEATRLAELLDKLVASPAAGAG
jgi:DNA-binding MarR family transcriptional regulator